MSRQKIIMIGLLTAAVLLFTAPYSFQHAWQSQFTYLGENEAITASKHLESWTPIEFTSTSKMAKLTDDLHTPVLEETVSPPIKTEPLSERVTSYHMQVNVKVEEQMLEGEQTITWTNPGKKNVTELYFHLYPNAFKSANTTFMKESGGQLRGDRATEKSVGFMNIKSIETLEGESILPRLKFVSPDDGNHEDNTVATLKLLEPIPPGESVSLKLTFEVKLPQVFARMGYYEDFVMAGQWYPKLAAYETKGTRGRTEEGWNVHQYHGNSEFYSNFGLYNVRIYVPEQYTVAATGVQIKTSQIGNGRKLIQYYAEDVHDFAFALSPNFVVKEAAFTDEGVPGVRIKLYLDPTQEKLSDRYLHAAKSALASYGKWYGTYPYSTLSIVVPPKGASGAGGMEYPTLITALAADDPHPGYELERTVVHEIGHQFWYGIVASNEFEEAWLDEAFTSYAEEKVMENAYGVTTNHRIESSYMTKPAPLLLDSWKYDDHQHYAENVYMRGKLLLLDIESQVGSETMNKVLRTYFHTYQYKHPSTRNFQSILEQVTKKSWQTYFDKFVYGSETADLSVADIQMRTVTDNDQTIYESSITLTHNSGSSRKVPILLTFADGTQSLKYWAIEADTKLHLIERSSTPLLWVQIDHEQTHLLDHHQINNFMVANIPSNERVRWNLAASTVVSQLLKLLSW